MCPSRAGQACWQEKGRRSERQRCLNIGYLWEVVAGRKAGNPEALVETPEESVRGDTAGDLGGSYPYTARSARRQGSPTQRPLGVYSKPAHALSWMEDRHDFTWNPAFRDRPVVVTNCGSTFFHADRAVDGDSNLTVKSFSRSTHGTLHGETADPTMRQFNVQRSTFNVGKHRRVRLNADAAQRSSSSPRGMTCSTLDASSPPTVQGTASPRVVGMVRPKRLDLEAESSSMVLSHRVTFGNPGRRQMTCPQSNATLRSSRVLRSTRIRRPSPYSFTLPPPLLNDPLLRIFTGTITGAHGHFVLIHPIQLVLRSFRPLRRVAGVRLCPSGIVRRNRFFRMWEGRRCGYARAGSATGGARHGSVSR